MSDLFPCLRREFRVQCTGGEEGSKGATVSQPDGPGPAGSQTVQSHREGRSDEFSRSTVAFLPKATITNFVFFFVGIISYLSGTRHKTWNS